MLVLGIESSCDETAAAVVEKGAVIRSSVVASQINVHSRYGGVVPELASRKHIEAIVPVIQEALDAAGVIFPDIDGIAVTRGPGLMGSLIVGMSLAKSLAYGLGIPYVGVNHIEGHIAAVFLGDDPPCFPFIALVVSGGHTHLYVVKGFGSSRLLGQTRDDAAGEAYDKAAKMLNLGYPGGVIIDRLARKGNPSALSFPRALRGEGYDFSFSGLKTALLYHLRKRGDMPVEGELADLAASYQDAIVEVLVEKTIRAADETGIPRIVVAGGVASNSRLRERFRESVGTRRLGLFIPSPELCTDNAAMIAAVGNAFLERGRKDSLDLGAVSRWPLEE
ncbi:MAG: tRNA (adenosine(37)-N6)-threonylcarbamoyltransferase complex transferase subunit TsaD [Deltaproteobacteria bacterium]|nr:tRNA (adenosine(37)-N6)-threonylcarbamoyltransferase complex transferase subunit TsaD [Deltaproteobacteria bacterium]